MEALQQVLQEAAWQDADARVVISNHFVRYALVPWSDHLADEDENRAWVRHRFVELYGEPAGAAEYRWSEERANTLYVATAIDSDLVSTIVATLGTTSLRLRSIQPYFMAAFNRLRRHIKNAPAWIVVPESGRVCVAAVAAARWQTITSTLIGPHWQSELRAVLERRLLLAAEGSPAEVFAYGASAANMDSIVVGDIPVKIFEPRALPGYSPQTDPDYAMALSSVH
jgi:hypothetical protein